MNESRAAFFVALLRRGGERARYCVPWNNPGGRFMAQRLASVLVREKQAEGWEVEALHLGADPRAEGDYVAVGSWELVPHVLPDDPVERLAGVLTAFGSERDG